MRHRVRALRLLGTGKGDKNTAAPHRLKSRGIF
jgi:hypothetical protein